MEPQIADDVPGIALVEWQFPTTTTADLRVDPLQEQLIAEDARRARAFYPNLSTENKREDDYGLKTLTDHAESSYRAYAAGRADAAPPFLLNISPRLPAALQAVIDHGVRVVSFSVGSKHRLDGLDDVVRANPGVLFVVSTPHLPSDEQSVEAFGERPSVLATGGFPNVLLAGCLRYRGTQIDDDRAGKPLGTAANPFLVENQPTATTTPQRFMMSCDSSRMYGGAGSTSSAAPHLASLLQLILERRSDLGLTTTAADALADLDRVTHRAMAVEESGEVHEVSYFTLDTVLLNAHQPLLTDSIWCCELAHPDPLPL